MNIDTLVKNYADTDIYPTFAGPGYPIYYVVNSYLPICPSCANKMAKEDFNEFSDDKITDFDINYEDDDLHCDICDKQIPSAYGEE